MTVFDLASGPSSAPPKVKRVVSLCQEPSRRESRCPRQAVAEGEGRGEWASGGGSRQAGGQGTELGQEHPSHWAVLAQGLPQPSLPAPFPPLSPDKPRLSGILGRSLGFRTRQNWDCLLAAPSSYGRAPSPASMKLP